MISSFPAAAYLSLPGYPYDGRMLAEQFDKMHILTAILPDRAYLDRGHRGHGVAETKMFIAEQKRGVTRVIRKQPALPDLW